MARGLCDRQMAEPAGADKTVLHAPSKVPSDVKPIADAAPPIRRRVPLFVAAAAAAVVLVGAAAVWWLGRDHVTASLPSLEAQLEAALAKSIPVATPKSRKESAAAFARAAANSGPRCRTPGRQASLYRVVAEPRAGGGKGAGEVPADLRRTVRADRPE